MRRMKVIVSGAVLALIATMLVIGAPPPAAEAAVIRPFSQYFTTQTNGAIAITGNQLLTCPASTACTTAQTSATATQGNNDFAMQFLDADSDASTRNSSGATVSIPAGSRVLYAGLFWGAATTAGSGGAAATGTLNQLKLRTPGAGGYQTITATRPLDRLTNQGLDYSAYADITSIVQAAGAGMYWGADIAAATGTDRYGGWSIVVAYSNPSLPLRDLNVFGGYASVQTNEVVSTTISGFLTPATGTVNAVFGTVTYEGDVQLTGDYLSVGGTRLADPLNRSANFFAGRVTAGGANLTDRVPANLNTMAVDAKTIDAPNVLPNGTTSTNVTFGTSGDFYYPAALTSQIDLYAPNIQGQKSVVNLSGNTPAQVGDVLEYTVATSNAGMDPATNVVLVDPLPPGATYLPGSLRITTGANTGSLTDATGDDQGEVSGGNVVVRLGAGATATSGGRLDPGASTTIRFRVQVDRAAAGSTITNGAGLTYTAMTLNRAYTYETNQVNTPVGTLADVAITKIGPATVTAGSQITWTLVATNTGPNAAADVVVTDALPAGVSFVSAAGATCAANGGITCQLGTLASGATRTITVVGWVAPDSTATSLTNVASITTSTADSNPANNTSAATAALAQSADLSLTKSATPTNPAPGQSVTWTLTATNAGPSTAAGVVITDTVPVGMTVTGTTPATCTVAARDVSCALPDLAPGGTATVTITTRLDPAWQATAPMTNSGYVQSTTPDSNTANNHDSATVTPAGPVADLEVSKTTLTNPVRAGLPVQYQVTVTNNGPSRAYGVTLTDTLPASLTAPSFNTDAGTCALAGATITCDLGDLALGATATVTITAQVASGATGNLSNTATVTSTSSDPNAGNNSDTVTNAVVTRADVAITKTAGPAVAGQNVTYTLTVNNWGLSDARDVVVSDTIPQPLTFVSATTAQGTCSQAAGTVTCQLGTVPLNGEVVITVVAHLPAGTDPAAVITNTAQVTSSTPDPDATNNTASYTLPVGTAADVSIAKTGPARATAGNQITWTLTIANSGPSTAEGVTVTDSIPDGVTGVTTNNAACTVGAQVSCALGTLAVGATVTIQVTGTVAATFTGNLLVNDATVTSTTPDPTTSNNSDTTRTPVFTEADLALTKTGPPTITAGTQITWTLTLTNAGPSVARTVSVTDTLPTGVTFVSSGDENGVTCTSSGPHDVRCARDSLGVNQSVTVTIVGLVAPFVAPGTTLTNTATIGATTPTPPGAQDDDTAIFTTTVTAAADLSITKTSDPNPMIAGTPATYTLVVSNTGPSTATGVTISDVLPAGLSVISVQAAGTCDVAGQTLTCQLGTVAPGSSTTVTIGVMVAATQVGTLTNTATVASTTPDPNPANNSATVVTPVETRADLTLTKSADRGTVAAGEGMTYTLVVVNSGPSDATGVVITDTIPTGMELILHSDGCTVAGNTVTCPVGDVPVGGTATVTLTVRIPSGSTATAFTNTATVTSDVPDPDLTGNTSTHTVTVTTAANVSVTKTAAPAVVIAGGELSWLVVVSNAGPSAARNVVLTDAVPEPLQIISAAANGTPCDVTGRDVSCDLGTLPPGQVTVTIETRVPAGATVDEVANRATVTTSTPDPNPDDNSATASAHVARQADLEITKSMSPTNPVPGQRVTFTMTAVNHGPSVAENVTITDTLPAGLLSATATGSGPTGAATCMIAPLTDTTTEVPVNSGLLRCQYGNLPVGATITATVTATISPSLTGTLTNAANVSAATLDPQDDNNTDDVTGDLSPTADVSVTKTIVGSAVAGQQVRWRIVVSSLGPSTSRDVTVSDPVPATVSAVRAETDAGTCQVVGGRVNCTLPEVVPGHPVTITVTGTLARSATGTLTNGVTITPVTPDPQADNNTSEVTTPITQPTGPRHTDNLPSTGADVSLLALLGALLAAFLGVGVILVARRRSRRR